MELNFTNLEELNHSVKIDLFCEEAGIIIDAGNSLTLNQLMILKLSWDNLAYLP